MVTGKSLLSQIPMPNRNTPDITTNSVEKKPTEIIASVKGGDVKDTSRPAPQGFWEKIREKLIEYRINKIEQKSPEQRTAIEQAEYEANQRNLNCMV